MKMKIPVQKCKLMNCGFFISGFWLVPEAVVGWRVIQTLSPTNTVQVFFPMSDTQLNTINPWTVDRWLWTFLNCSSQA